MNRDDESLATPPLPPTLLNRAGITLTIDPA